MPTNVIKQQAKRAIFCAKQVESLPVGIHRRKRKYEDADLKYERKHLIDACIGVQNNKTQKYTYILYFFQMLV